MGVNWTSRDGCESVLAGCESVLAGCELVLAGCELTAAGGECAAAVELEPCHFGALSGLGLCHIALGRAPPDRQDLIKPSCHSKIQFSRQFFTVATRTL
eukprot:1179213-Prorocentrum_minimum.AAC.1